MQASTLRESKVQEFEALINERLKVELQSVQDERDRLHEQIAHCIELRNNMTMVQDQQRRSLKTMVDLGCNFYVQARMYARAAKARSAQVLAVLISTHGRGALLGRPDTSWVYVDVGLGFHAQMTPAEAIAFSTQREGKLTEATEALRQRAAKLKAQIKLTIGAIDEIIAGRRSG